MKAERGKIRDSTIKLLTASEVPRLENGGIALCHRCQRSAQLSRGFLRLLARDLRSQSKARIIAELRR